MLPLYSSDISAKFETPNSANFCVSSFAPQCWKNMTPFPRVHCIASVFLGFGEHLNGNYEKTMITRNYFNEEVEMKY